ncbi:MAG: tol-pal system-associated acyl-CoA thioesterase [Betaproteobacteria bacterium]|nr:tol-pal system-associated acyl-CoA thioesterase [Betaproteobacteria bacterium]MBU6513983.1 tol-pal system-associated acyl-CoA thioesterase [Betaproteobacteria bacterium]MDE1957246.1 tol-pal system-associated acyl-CoA thioesterase [Betaproteobacteria bacterium]MDE2153671.1 tol-pal system-associated acyl-CoA thioesterase [Betaproteobacteria bacterium]
MLATTPSPRDSFARFVLPLRVYWEDTDAGGVVYYANYLKFCERARTEWLRALGIDQQRLADTERLMFVVSSAQVRYLSPARLDDALLVGVDFGARGAASLEFVQQIRRDDAERTLLAEARVLVACVQAQSFRPQRMPERIRRAVG